MVSPIARFVVSLGMDGRIVSQGAFSDVLAKDNQLAAEINNELVPSKDLKDKVITEVDITRQEGKLIAAEEIMQGHVSWQTC